MGESHGRQKPVLFEKEINQRAGQPVIKLSKAREPVNFHVGQRKDMFHEGSRYLSRAGNCWDISLLRGEIKSVTPLISLELVYRSSPLNLRIHQFYQHRDDVLLQPGFHYELIYYP